MLPRTMRAAEPGRAALVAGTVLATLLAVAGCSSPAPEPRPTTSAGTPSASASPEDAVTTDAEVMGAPLNVTVHPVQAADGAALLTMDVAMPLDAPEGSSLSLGVLLRDPGSFLNAGQVRLLDLASATVLEAARDDRNQAVTTGGPLNLAPGDSVTVQAYFAAPAARSVDVLLPYLGLVPGVPVTSVATLATSAEELGASGDLTFPTASIDAFTVGFDDSSSARVEGSTATVTLSSDVLFATDEFALTPQAAAVVDAAAQQILDSGRAGDVTVVGHTDDVGTDAYNQELSVKRAQSVADRLVPALGAGYTLAVDGRGESEPVAPGSSPEARAANRRVEIGFASKDPGAAVDVPSAVPAPEPTGPVATGTGTVSLDVDGVGYDVRVESVERRAGYLVGVLRVERTTAGKGSLTGLFGDFATGLSLGRGLGTSTLAAGAFNVSLLGEGSRLYPGDYVVAGRDAGSSERRTVVADRFLDAPVEQGQPVTVTVLWPDPGGAVVDVDVPERFRITDVPVQDA